jgi:hypothetical protein
MDIFYVSSKMEGWNINCRIPLLVMVMQLVGISAPADAAVLCSNPSGSVFVRAQCKANEQQLDPAALGLGGISGYQIVTHQEFLAPGTFANVHVECPTGKKVLGGGFDIETPDDVKVFSSEPSDGQGNLIDHGWNAFVHNAGSLTRQSTVSAICASAE